MLIYIGGSALAIGAGIALGWIWAYYPCHLLLPAGFALLPGFGISLLGDSRPTRELVLPTLISTLLMTLMIHAEMYWAFQGPVDGFWDFLETRLERGEIVIPTKHGSINASGGWLLFVWILDVAIIAAVIWLMAKRRHKPGQIIR